MKLQTLAAFAYFMTFFVSPVLAQGPAVSAANGKFEFDAGALNVPQVFVSRAAGTLTLPLGDAFGLQVDASLAEVNGLTGAAALHLFTRDPQSYLIGGTLGVVATPGATVVAAGPEGELYLGRWTLEAWGGVGLAHPSSGPDRVGPFEMVDAAYYPHDNLRLSFGFSLLDGFAALHAGAEYLFSNGPLPFSLTADTRLGADGSLLATIGLRGYIGGGDKTLIARHRQDDPWDRGETLVSAVGGATTTAPSSSPAGPSTPPELPMCAGAQQQVVDGVQVCQPWPT